MKIPLLLALVLMTGGKGICQSRFESSPSKAEFITSDIPAFWKAFDQLNTSKKNPFGTYLDEGSAGLKDFIPYRIESPKKLLKTVKARMADYENIRESSMKVEAQTSLIRDFYAGFKELYKNAVFPPAYFVIGAFNSGGTSSGNGLIIGVEMQSEIENVPYIVAHELIHFNQHYPSTSNPSLLEQSIKEGSADFIGELISGKNINNTAMEYFNNNEKQLCMEFVEIMNDTKYHGWLYGSSGKKEGRPNDLGYSIGYKISESFYNQTKDKEKAISEILNPASIQEFVEASGYLNPYLR